MSRTIREIEKREFALELFNKLNRVMWDLERDYNVGQLRAEIFSDIAPQEVKDKFTRHPDTYLYMIISRVLSNVEFRKKHIAKIKKLRKENRLRCRGEEKRKTYLIKDSSNGLYKIGYSSEPYFREKTLQSEKPIIKMVKVWDKDIESELHKEFNHVRVRGEWFSLNKVQVERICKTY